MRGNNLAVVACLLLTGSGASAAFTPGNLVVFQVPARALTNTTGNLFEFNTTSASQAPVATYAIPDSATASNGLRFSGSASTTSYLSLSNDRTQLNFAGVVTTDTSSNVNTITSRGVGTYTSQGVYSRPTTYTGLTASQTRSATTLNNSAYYIGDQNGIYTNGATTPGPTNNFRSVRSFGGTVYALSTTAGTSIVGTISAPSGGTFTGLPGVSTTDTVGNDFYLISSGDNGAALDVLYTLSNNTDQANGTITKYSFVGGTWTSNGTYLTVNNGNLIGGGFGLAAQDVGNGAALYMTTGNGSTGGNRLLRLNDTGGFNAPITIDPAGITVLHAAAAGTSLKGIDFAPVAVPEPASLACLGIAGFAVARRRRS